MRALRALPWLLLLVPCLPVHAAVPLPRYVVIVVLDGARPDYFRLAPMPNLHWLMKRGTFYSNAWVGQEIANTPPSHATIGTGVFPGHHGIQGFWWKDPRTGGMTRPTDTDQVQSGALERVMLENHAPSLAGALKAADPQARVIAASGHKCYAADALGTSAADYILCALIYHDRWVAQAMGVHRPPPGAINNPHWDVPIPDPRSNFAAAVQQWNSTTENDWTVRYALWTFTHTHARLMMLNLPETDVLGHFAVHPDQTMAQLMRGVDRDLGLIIATYRRAGVLNRTDFIITADHGMSRAQVRLPFSDLDRAIELAGATKVFLEADMAAVIGIEQPDKARAVARNVALLGGPLIDATYYKVQHGKSWQYEPAYVRPDLPYTLRRAYLTLTDTMASPSGADVFAVYAPHVTTGDRPANGYHWLAGHLGPQWDEQHIPLLIAGPGIRHGTSAFPARLVDIAPTAARLLGARLRGTDGIVLADALEWSTGHERQLQQHVLRTLAPLQSAIRARSGE